MSKNGKLVNEFKDFILKGNIVDMAVGVIIGGAFSKIVTSLVNDIFMPALGMLTGGVNFTELKCVLSPAEYDITGALTAEAVVISYGMFIQNIIDFLLIGICMFLVIKAVVKVNNRFRKAEAELAEQATEVPESPTAEQLLTEIRDLLKADQ